MQRFVAALSRLRESLGAGSKRSCGGAIRERDVRPRPGAPRCRGVSTKNTTRVGSGEPDSRRRRDRQGGLSGPDRARGRRRSCWSTTQLGGGARGLGAGGRPTRRAVALHRRQLAATGICAGARSDAPGRGQHARRTQVSEIAQLDGGARRYTAARSLTAVDPGPPRRRGGGALSAIRGDPPRSVIVLANGLQGVPDARRRARARAALRSCSSARGVPADRGRAPQLHGPHLVLDQRDRLAHAGESRAAWSPRSRRLGPARRARHVAEPGAAETRSLSRSSSKAPSAGA